MPTHVSHLGDRDTALVLFYTAFPSAVAATIEIKVSTLIWETDVADRGLSSVHNTIPKKKEQLRDLKLKISLRIVSDQLSHI